MSDQRGHGSLPSQWRAVTGSAENFVGPQFKGISKTAPLSVDGIKGNAEVDKVDHRWLPKHVTVFQDPNEEAALLFSTYLCGASGSRLREVDSGIF
ncbi:unnamed protein product [Echinostoma caproni]|uniref:Uncharacterized protein n=1 Tax=Echinostoma caproni TaxID=27848 RepID=A0A183B1W6_9TREM|nr:unnamed protein product [Echinostoma caproni]